MLKDALKGQSPYTRSCYCPKCERWIPKTQLYIFKSRVETVDGQTVKRHEWFVCPHCLKRVRTKALKNKDRA